MIVIIVDSFIVHLSCNGIIVILPLAPENLHIPAAHVLPVSSESEVNLHCTSKDNKGLARKPSILVDQQHIHNIQSSKKLENVDVGAVERKPPQTNHRKGRGLNDTPVAIRLKATCATAHCEVGI
ncbi:hypothetical protein PanWU01x14_109750 [Parasponia andersonii]|uniref:Uncharacterized protein n=1 Tax=Parasponia andersonii TaxID=3476 RepID=A0A2P5CZT8_PARAD|nr:hypothetical protein PanWU01x14_109750 [Parasponia andersonii]